MNKNTASNSPSSFETMTLGAALRTVGVIKGEIAEHGQRAIGCLVTVTVEGIPANPHVFDFVAERKARENAVERLIRLQSAIAVGNARTFVTFEGHKMPLAEAIRRREELKGDTAWLKGLSIQDRIDVRDKSQYVAGSQNPVTSQVKTTYVSALSERDRVAQVDALQRRMQALNLLIESTNHRTLIKVETLPDPEPAPSV